MANTWKRCFLALALGTACLAPELAADCSAELEDTDKDGKPDQVVLENEFTRLVFTADGFGKAFIYKPTGTDVLGGKSGGLFYVDVFELPNWQGTSQNMARETKVVKDTPDEAAIELALQMPKMVSRPKYDKMRLSLTLTVRKGVNAIFGRNVATNGADEDQPITFRQAIRKNSPGVIWGTYVPDIEGPRVAMDLEPGPYSFPALSGTMPCAWLGGVDEKGFGLAGSFEWKYIDMVECWCSKSPDATLQWAYRSQPLGPGKSWSTEFVVTCFEGFEEVSGMANGVVGQLEVGDLNWQIRSLPDNKTQFPPLKLEVGKPVPVEVKVAAITPRKLTIEFGSRRLPDKELKVENKVEVSVETRNAATQQFTWTPASEGTHVVAARILEDGKPALLMEKPFVIGATDQAYFAEMPAEEQMGEALIGAQIAEPPLHEATVTLDLEAVQIPRKPFGRNFANGPLSLLFVCQPKHDLVSARELYQRMDLVMEHLVVPDGDRGQTRRLLERLAAVNPKVLFLSGYPWNKTRALTMAANIIIQGRVSKGMGLVMLAPHALLNDPKSPLSQFLAPAQPVNGVPFGEEVAGRTAPVRLYTLGEGRIALIDGHGGWAYDAAVFAQRVDGIPPAFLFWDYGLSLWMKAIHWAGKHEADLRFSGFKFDGTSLNFEIARDNAAGEQSVTLRWQLLDASAQKEATGATGVGLSQPKQPVRLQLPSSPSGGQHLIEITAVDSAGKTLRWASHLFEVKPEVGVTVDLAIKDRYLARGEPVAGKVLLSQPKPAVRTLDVDLQVEDAWGRLIAQTSQRVSFSDKEYQLPFSFDLWDVCRHDRHALTATVRSYDRIFSRAKAGFSLRWRPHRYRDDFAVGMWTTPTRDLLGYVTTMSARGVGMDYFYHEHPFDPNYRRYIGPEAFNMGGPDLKQDNKTLTCTPSLCDANAIAALKVAFRKEVEKMAAGDVRFWMLQDERSFRGEYDYSEPTLAAFRDWLKLEYPTLEALNKQWETQFKDWNEVRPLTREDFGKEGRKTANISIWLDFRRFMGKVWADWTRYALEVVKEVCPDGEVGMGGIFAPAVWSGVDFWLASQVAKVGARYNGMQEEWYHSFAPDSAVGQWGGYGPRYPSEGNLLHPWRQLFHEGHFVWYYKYYANPGGYAYQGAFNCDGTLHGMYNALVEEHGDMKRGIGRLLLNAKWLDDGIYFPYSQSTILANEFLGLPQTVYTMKTIVENLGYQHRFLAYAQIEAGELASPQRAVRLFFLPSITCLSSKETEAIRQFVAQGGVLVADRLAGVRDQHGRAWDGTSPLDELFGIDRSALGEAVTGTVRFEGEKTPEALKGQAIQTAIPESGLKLRGAAAWGKGPADVPVVTVNRYKKGTAIYLNLDVSAYSRMQGGGAVRPELITEAQGDEGFIRAMDGLFNAVLGSADIGVPRVTLRPKGAKSSLGESSFWSNEGKHLYLGFRPAVPTSVEAEMEWQRRGHVYDMRTGRYYGLTQKLDLTVFPGRALVFSNLPYRVASLDLHTSRSAGTAWHPGETVELMVSLGITDEVERMRPGKHVFRIDVLDPSENPVEAHSGNFDSMEGQLTVRLPLALNAPEGQWTIRMRDLASGVVGVERFEVSAVK
jgi:hypothetical protein